MRNVEDDTCRFSYEESETSAHLLCDCVTLFATRVRYFDKVFLQPSEIWYIQSCTVINFIRHIFPCGETSDDHALRVSAHSDLSP